MNLGVSIDESQSFKCCPKCGLPLITTITFHDHDNHLHLPLVLLPSKNKYCNHAEFVQYTWDSFLKSQIAERYVVNT